MAKYVPPSRRDGSFLSDQTDSLTRGMKQLTVEEEYPVLSKKKPNGAKAPTAAAPAAVAPGLTAAAAAVVPGRATYASLASNWAEQTKANEEKAKKEAEDELIKSQLRKKANEVKVIPVRHSVVKKKRPDSDDDKELDIGCHVSDHSEHSDPSDYADEIIDDEEEEEVEEDPDAFWTQRKHKGDMY
jgi:hypothetical protein